MADDQYIKILQKGKSHWNQWRKENPDIKIDFSGLIFKDFNFSNLPSGVYIGDAQNAIKNNVLYKFIPIGIGGIIKEYYENKYLGQSINFSDINFSDSVLENVDFTGADFSNL